MNGFDSSAWRRFGLGLALAGVTGCAKEPTEGSSAPAIVPAPVHSYVDATPPGSPAAGSLREKAPQELASPRPLPVSENDPPIDAVSLSAWNELLRPDLSPEAWETARQTLLDRSVEAESLLVHELTSDDPYHREMAATLLGQSGVPSEKAQPALRKCLEDDSPFVRANAAAALASVPEHAEAVVSVLTRLLRDDNPQLRKMAAVNLGSFGVEAAPEVEVLASVLDDKDEEVVLPVVQLLGRIGQKAEPAMPKLQQIAFEQEGEIRKAAESAIQQIRAPEAGKN